MNTTSIAPHGNVPLLLAVHGFLVAGCLIALLGYMPLAIGSAVIAILVMNAYYLQILYSRLQVSLLCWLISFFVLGNLEGLILTTSGIRSDPLSASLLALALSAWVFKALTVAIVRSELLGLDTNLGRVLFVVIHLAYSLAPAFVLAGSAILYLRSEYLYGNMGEWFTLHMNLSWNLIYVGIALMLPGLYFEFRTYKAALKINQDKAELCA